MKTIASSNESSYNRFKETRKEISEPHKKKAWKFFEWSADII